MLDRELCPWHKRLVWAQVSVTNIWRNVWNVNDRCPKKTYLFLSCNPERKPENLVPNVLFVQR